MDAELEHFKQNIDIADVAESNGWTLHERSTEKWPAYKKDGATILIWKDSSDGHYLYKKDEKTGSIIDFCQNEMSLSLGRIRQYLRTYTPSPSQPAAQNQKTSSFHSAQSVTDMSEEWKAMPAYSGSYLRNRGIKAETVELFDVRQDSMSNACFKHYNLKNSEVIGWEVKNAAYTGFNRGGSRGLGVQVVGNSRDLPTIIIVTETAIDSMSYYQLHKKPKDNQKFVYISTGGALTLVQQETLVKLMQQYPSAQLILAQDADEAGEKMAQRLAIHAPRQPVRDIPPEGKDWNDYLQSRVAQQAKQSQKAVEAEVEAE